MGSDIETVVAYVGLLIGRHPALLLAADRPEITRQIADTFQVDTILRPGTAHPVEQHHPPARDLHPDLAVLLSTSGSTGSSKVVRLSRRNLQSNAESIVEYLQIMPDDIAALSLPLHYSYGMSVLNSHLQAGAAVYLPPYSPSDPEFIPDLIARKVTNLPGVPYTFDLLERHGLRQIPGMPLRFMTVAGGRMEPDMVRAYGAWMKENGGRFYVMYGQTEAAPRIAYLPPEETSRHPDCIGRAIPGGDLYLRNDAGDRIDDNGVVGELVYSGPNVMMGYAGSREELRLGAVTDELITGDLAERIEGGFFRIVGRRSRFSKIAGLRLGHDDIQGKLQPTCPGCVVTGNDALLGIAIGPGQDTDRVRSMAARITGLPAGRIGVVSYDALPRLPSGKPDLRQILADALQTAETRERTVLASFQRAFWPRQVADTESFVSLGGDSLTYLQLAMALEDIIDPLPDGWEERSIRDLDQQPKSQSEQVGTSRKWTSVDPDIYLRAAAIALIVFNHLAPLPPLQGGADLLMALVGYSIARFQFPSYLKGDFRGPALQLFRNLAYYYVILGALVLYGSPVTWENVLLVSNFQSNGHEPLLWNLYWFVEAYALLTLSVMGLMAISPLRRLVERHPYSTGLLAVLLCLIGRHYYRMTYGMDWNACSEEGCWALPEVAYIGAIGWMAYFSATQGQKLLTAGILLLVLVKPVVWYDGQLHDLVELHSLVAALWPAAALMLIMSGVKIAATASVAAAIRLFAANSYFIYLFHTMPFALIYTHRGYVFGHPVWDAAVYIALGLSLGFLAGASVRILTRLAAQSGLGSST